MIFSNDVSLAVASFFEGGKGATHSEISNILIPLGLNDNYRFNPNSVGAQNKKQRVLSAFRKASQRGISQALLEQFLSLFRHEGSLVGSDGLLTADGVKLREALAIDNWRLADDGRLHPGSSIDLETGGRVALDETLERLRGSVGDPALAIGTAKDLLEAVAKFVLEELGMLGADMKKNIKFEQVWHIARERLDVLPKNIDKGLPGYKQIRQIHQSSWDIARNVNELRNLQGTGHGRTLPTGVSEELALLVVREACSVAEYMLRLLDKKQGR